MGLSRRIITRIAVIEAKVIDRSITVGITDAEGEAGTTRWTFEGEKEEVAVKLTLTLSLFYNVTIRFAEYFNRYDFMNLSFSCAACDRDRTRVILNEHYIKYRFYLQYKVSKVKGKESIYIHKHTYKQNVR